MRSKDIDLLLISCEPTNLRIPYAKQGQDTNQVWLAALQNRFTTLYHCLLTNIKNINKSISVVIMTSFARILMNTR